MGSKNSISAVYMSNNDVFSDVINLAYFDGKNVILPEMLHELDPKHEFIGNTKGIEKIRDVYKSCSDQNGTRILRIYGIENQSKVDYQMALRMLTNDVLGYGDQARDIKREHEQKKNLKSKEFISGFSKDDRLKPIYSACVFWGKGEWDALSSFRDLVDEKDERMKKFLPDYKMCLISPKDFDDEVLLETKSTLGRVFGFMKYARDQIGLNRFLSRLKAKGKQGFGHQETKLVNAFVNAHLVVPKEGEETDVCEAFEQNRLEGLKDGKQEMYVQSCQEFQCSYKDTLKRFENKFHTSKVETKKIVDQYWMVH